MNTHNADIAYFSFSTLLYWTLDDAYFSLESLHWPLDCLKMCQFRPPWSIYLTVIWKHALHLVRYFTSTHCMSDKSECLTSINTGMLWEIHRQVSIPFIGWNKITSNCNFVTTVASNFVFWYFFLSFLCNWYFAFSQVKWHSAPKYILQFTKFTLLIFLKFTYCG